MKNIVTHKVKYVCFFVLAILFGFNAISQNSFKQTLDIYLKRVSLDNKLEILDSAAKYFSSNDIASSLYFNNLILEDIMASSNQVLQYNILDRIIQDAQFSNNRILELNTLNQKVSIAIQNNDKTVICKTFKSLGDYYKKAGDYPKSIHYYYNSASYYKKNVFLMPEAILSKLEIASYYAQSNKINEAKIIYTELSQFANNTQIPELHNRFLLLQSRIQLSENQLNFALASATKLISNNNVETSLKIEAYIILTDIYSSTNAPSDRDQSLKKALNLSRIEGNTMQTISILKRLLTYLNPRDTEYQRFEKQLAQSEELISFSSGNNNSIVPDSATTMNIFTSKLNEITDKSQKNNSGFEFYSLLILFMIVLSFAIIILKYKELLHYYKRITYYTQRSLEDQNQLIHENQKLRSRLQKIERANLKTSLPALHNNTIEPKKTSKLTEKVSVSPKKVSENISEEIHLQIINPSLTLQNVISAENAIFSKQDVYINFSKDIKVPQKLISDNNLLKGITHHILSGISSNLHNADIDVYLRFDKIDAEHIWLNIIFQCPVGVTKEIIQRVLDFDKNELFQTSMQKLNAKTGSHTLLNDKMTIWINLPFRYDIKNFIAKSLSV